MGNIVPEVVEEARKKFIAAQSRLNKLLDMVRVAKRDAEAARVLYVQEHMKNIPATKVPPAAKTKHKTKHREVPEDRFSLRNFPHA